MASSFFLLSYGSSLRKFTPDIPAEIQEKLRGIFYVDKTASWPYGIPGDFSMWKFPSCFPQKCQNAIYWHRTGPSYMLISQWWFNVILWWNKIFTGLGKFPSHFDPYLKISPEFPCGFPPWTTTIPRDSPKNPQDFACSEKLLARI